MLSPAEVGRVLAFHQHTVELSALKCRIGERLTVGGVPAEVVGFDRERVVATLLGPPQGIGPETEAVASGRQLGVSVGPGLLGRVLDGLGRPLDGLEALPDQFEYPLHRPAPPLVERQPVERVLASGVRAVDALLTLGAGQSLSFQAERGTGKRTTLSMFARQSAAHSVVFASVGEPASELQDFLARDLGLEGLERSVVVAATGDASVAERLKAPYTALAIAEYLRDQGQDVLFILDSVPCWRSACREMSWPGGALHNLLARSGARKNGTITSLLVTDACPENNLLSLTEGHICLSKKIAHSGRYPAIDVAQSVSRRFTQVASRQHQEGAKWLRSVLVCHQENELLIQSGAYKPGFNAAVDRALALHPECQLFLKQDVYGAADFEETLQRLAQLKKTPDVQDL